MNTIKIRIIGTRPMLMHSDKFADPLNPATKAHKQLTSKRKKTDEDQELIAKSEFLGSLYIDEDGPYLPGINVESAIVGGGKLSKMGTTLKRGFEVIDEKCHLIYDGPKTAEKLWEKGFYDARSVKVSTSKLIRYRPIFKKWAAEFTVVFDAEIIDKAQIIKCIQDAGAYVGIGDFRPKFGRFEVAEV